MSETQDIAERLLEVLDHLYDEGFRPDDSPYTDVARARDEILRLRAELDKARADPSSILESRVTALLDSLYEQKST